MASTTGGQQKPPERMRKVDFNRDDLTVKDKEYIQKMTEAHKKNVERISKAKYVKRNGIIALALGASALGIYAYSIHSVSQESFLEDFDDPKK